MERVYYGTNYSKCTNGRHLKKVSVDPFYSDENMARLKKSIAQMEATGGTVHEVNTND